MSDVIIKAEGLGKKYIISHEAREKYTALRDVIDQKTRKLLNNRSKQTFKEDFWALRDVNFEVKRGEAIGVIGRNGAGKSTLLKILSRITEPTTGRVEIDGRISSLLEVGTGFHPELTGKENIFLNGAILGMSRTEIKKKFDAIVDFSGVERFLDTPVKRFSSGMYLRLAFAVAAHLEPEILIVDEVLAVGDAEFQKKCLGKMDEVSKTEGRTVLFVSHNMKAIQQLCSKVFVLKDGELHFEGETIKGIGIYNNTAGSGIKNEISLNRRNIDAKKAYVSEVNVKQDHSSITIGVVVEARETIEKAEIAVGINDFDGNRIITLHSRFIAQQFTLVKGRNEFVCLSGNFFLKPGIYSMHVFVGNNYETIDYLNDPVHFEIKEYAFYPAGNIPDNSQGALMANYSWTLKT